MCVRVRVRVMGMCVGVYERGLNPTKRNFKVASLVWCPSGWYPEQHREMDQEERGPGTSVLSQAAPPTPCELGGGHRGELTVKKHRHYMKRHNTHQPEG